MTLHTDDEPTGATPMQARWQPIETAPRDGTRVLLGRHDNVMLGYWEFSEGPGWWTDSEWWGNDHFTRWQPLPAPPTEDGQ